MCVHGAQPGGALRGEQRRLAGAELAGRVSERLQRLTRLDNAREQHVRQPGFHRGAQQRQVQPARMLAQVPFPHRLKLELAAGGGPGRHGAGQCLRALGQHVRAGGHDARRHEEAGSLDQVRAAGPHLQREGRLAQQVLQCAHRQLTARVCPTPARP